MTDLVEQVARNLRRDFNIREFDRDDDTGWEADVEEAESAIKAIDAARVALSPHDQTQPFAWYWHDQHGCLYITGDDRKPEAPADAKPLYECPPQEHGEPSE